MIGSKSTLASSSLPHCSATRWTQRTGARVPLPEEHGSRLQTKDVRHRELAAGRRRPRSERAWPRAPPGARATGAGVHRPCGGPSGCPTSNARPCPRRAPRLRAIEGFAWMWSPRVSFRPRFHRTSGKAGVIVPHGRDTRNWSSAADDVPRDDRAITSQEEGS